MTTKFKRKLSAHEGLIVFLAMAPIVVILVIVGYLIGLML
jgi:hypothetical protein